MPMIGKNMPGHPRSTDLGAAQLAQDEGLAAAVSAYLDGELAGEDLTEFEALLQNNEALAREIAEMRRIDRQLSGLGADILDEPIPETLLEALSQLESR